MKTPPTCPCRICKLPNAKEVLERVRTISKKAGESISGISHSTFLYHVNLHEKYEVNTAPPPPTGLPGFPTDLKQADPEDLLWLITAELIQLGKTGKATDQGKTTSLKEARETILKIHELRATKQTNTADPIKEVVELEKSLMEKISTYVPHVPPAPVDPATPVLPPSPSTEAGLVH